MIAIIPLTFRQRGHSKEKPMQVNEMANRVDPDQTAPLVAV